MTADLRNTAENIVADMLPTDGKFDLDHMEEELDEYVFSAAESACIYYHWCADIISRYESEGDTESADDMGKLYKPSEYQQAMADYAFWIARSVIDSNVREILDEIRESADELESELAAMGIEFDGLRISRDCPHGWAAHNRENENGGCYWLSRQLDGCNAIAFPVAGVWLSHTWEPALATCDTD